MGLRYVTAILGKHAFVRNYESLITARYNRVQSRVIWLFVQCNLVPRVRGKKQPRSIPGFSLLGLMLSLNQLEYHERAGVYPSD